MYLKDIWTSELCNLNPLWPNYLPSSYSRSSGWVINVARLPQISTLVGRKSRGFYHLSGRSKKLTVSHYFSYCISVWGMIPGFQKCFIWGHTASLLHFLRKHALKFILWWLTIYSRSNTQITRLNDVYPTGFPPVQQSVFYIVGNRCTASLSNMIQVTLQRDCSKRENSRSPVNKNVGSRSLIAKSVELFGILTGCVPEL